MGWGGCCWCRCWWEGVGGLEEKTGGCSTAHYGVTTSKIPSSPDFITPPLPKRLSHATAESLQSWESCSTATLKFQTFLFGVVSKAFHGAKLAKDEGKNDTRAHKSPKRCLYFMIIFSHGDILFLKTAEDAVH